MNRSSAWRKALVLGGALILAGALNLSGAGQADITVSQTPEGHDIRYVSGKTVYAEGLVNGRWMACQ